MLTTYSYLESDGQDAKLRPIFWIGLLFVGKSCERIACNCADRLGPLVGSLSIQYYIFVMTRALVRTEAILTQLLFDHSLRLRMKDSTGDEDKTGEKVQAGPPVPAINVEAVGPAGEVAQEAMAIDGQNTGDGVEGSPETTEVGSQNGSSKGKAAATEPAKVPGAPQQGLAGKINVLMAADIESLVEGASYPGVVTGRQLIGTGRDIPLVAVFTPIQVTLCIVFLYKVLSWSKSFRSGDLAT